MGNNNENTIEDIKKIYSNIKVDRQNFIFREFTKNKNKFVATDNFFISEEIGDSKIGFICIDLKNYNSYFPFKKTNEKIVPYLNYTKENDMTFPHEVSLKNNDKDLQFLYVNNQVDKKFINLLVLSDIAFSMNDKIISKNEIIQKFIDKESDYNNKSFTNFSEKFIEDLYYNEEFSNKINIKMPNKNIIKILSKKDLFISNEEEINKKYLFKIEILEVPLTFSQENIYFNKIFF